MRFADAKDASAKATALRNEEATTFSKDFSDYKTNLAALTAAIAALKKGVKAELEAHL